MLMPRPWLALALTVLAAASARADVSGRARIIDGNTVEIAGQRIRLLGIAAPRADQICHTKWDKPYPCGVLAAQVLASLTASQSLTCRGEDRDKAGRLLGICYAGAVDINEQMVLRGWALADPDLGARYRPAERAARQVADGLWKGKFVPPWKWRPE